MKRQLLFVLLVLMAMVGMAQNSKIDVLYNEKSIGTEVKDQKEIMAQEYVFPKRIHDIYVDTLSGYVTLKLRKLSKNGKVLDISGVVLVFDPHTKTVKWDKKMEFTSTDIQTYQHFMTQTSGNKLIALNIENGEKLWSIKSDLYYIDQQQHIGIGYKYEGLTGNLHILEGLNLSTGETLWEKELSRSYGWNKIIALNDSTLLIAASGLHTINIHNGSGWDYTTVTGKKDYTETIAKNAVGVTLGVLTGTYITSSGPNLVRDVVSNVILDSSNLYIASKESISKIDTYNGQVLWTTPLPEDLTSRSFLVFRDSLLCMVNTGYAYWGGKKINFGTPFILGLNPETGAQRFYNIIGEEKDPISDFKIEKDTLLIAFNNRIATYGLYDGAQGFSRTVNTDELGELTSFLGDRVYTKVDEHRFSPLQLMDSTKYYLHTDKSTILALDKQFNVTQTYDYNALYYHYGHLKHFTLLAKDGQTVILNEHHNERATLNVSYHAIAIGTTLYDVNDKSLLVIDLSTLLDDATGLDGF